MKVIEQYYEIFRLIDVLKSEKQIILDISLLDLKEKKRVKSIIKGIIYGSNAHVSLVKSLDENVLEVRFEPYSLDDYYKLLYEEVKYNITENEEVYDLIDKMKLSKILVCDLSFLKIEERIRSFDFISGAAAIQGYIIEQVSDLVISCKREV